MAGLKKMKLNYYDPTKCTAHNIGFYASWA